MKEINRMFITALCAVLVALAWVTSPAAQEKKPNILVIWGDDVGIHNISAYSLGVMGYKTPNIDRLAKEGALFTDAHRPAQGAGLHARPVRQEPPRRPQPAFTDGAWV